MGAEDGVAIISKGSNVYKLECVTEGRKTYMTWELRKEAVLETVFDGDGAVLRQRYEKLAAEDIERIINNKIAESMIPKVEHAPYTGITISKPCPKCGAKALKRYAELHKENPVPVMPLYVCSECGTKSYYLTDEYLDDLVKEHRELFTDQELKELDSNHEGFINELKEYIIRIFASKKIMCIKS